MTAPATGAASAMRAPSICVQRAYQPFVTVINAPRDSVPAWSIGPPTSPMDKRGNDVGGWDRLSLLDALQREWDGDAHAQVVCPRSMVESASKVPRIGKAAVADHPEMDWVLPIVFIDLDREPHDWWPTGEVAADALRGALGLLSSVGLRPFAAYATHKGLRFGFVLSEPVSADKWGWYERFLNEQIVPLPWAALGLSATSPTECKSIAQLFRLPRVNRPGLPEGLELPPVHIDEGAPLLVPNAQDSDAVPLSGGSSGPPPQQIPLPLPPEDPLWVRAGLFAWSTVPYLPTAADYASPPPWLTERPDGVQGLRSTIRHLAGRAVYRLHRSGMAPEDIPGAVWRLLASPSSTCRHGHDHSGAGPDYLWALVNLWASELEPPKTRVVQSTDLNAMVESFVGALQPSIYRRGNQPARPVLDGLQPITKISQMRLALDRVARVVQVAPGKDGEAPGEKPMVISKDHAELVLAADLSTLRPVEAVVRTPQITSEGEIEIRHGYDAVGRLYYAPEASWPEPPRVDGQGGADELAWRLLETLCSEIPFQADTDAAAALLAALTATLRPTLSYPVPAFLVTANRRNVGKTRLGRALCTLATGSMPGSVGADMSAKDWHKELIALAQTGQWVIFIDNQTSRLGNPHLAGLVVNRRISGRIFRTHDRVDVPLRAFILATMNDATVDRDFETRTVAIRLHRGAGEDCDPRTESPDTIAQREHLALRMQLMEIWAAYLRAGKPWDLDRRRMERFEEWDRDLGGCVAWAMGVDPLAATEAFLVEAADRDNPDRDLLEWILAGAVERQVRGLAAQLSAERRGADPRGVELEAILSAIEERDRSGNPHNARTLAKYLKSLQGDPPAGFSISSERRGGTATTTITGPGDSDQQVPQSFWPVRGAA